MASTRRLHVRHRPATLEQGIAAIKREQQLPLAFPRGRRGAGHARRGGVRGCRRWTAPTSRWSPSTRPRRMDLDQALVVERRGGGYRVYYAIADVAAFVTAGDPIDIEAHQRGETLYGADAEVPLHPKVLSEDAASLLPDQVRPALLWTIDLDATGEGIAVDVRRARVSSRAKLDYAGVQARIDAGGADPMWAVLREIGELRQQRERSAAASACRCPNRSRIGDDGTVDAGVPRAHGRWRTGTNRSRC